MPAEDEAAVALPPLSRDARCGVSRADVVQLMTRPPAHYTFATLIGAMMNAAAFVTDVSLRKVLKDNPGLGTEATRAGIVEQLLNRRFIARKGSKLMATDLGADVIDALPLQLTALWEQSLQVA
ncbi:DNA topoisomerase (plasmid) [Serratia symbiotica]|nr:DNA topoisomerase [Serratia symbiotica]USS96883.1 DNA topoisomerase [Serratia symbiotica]